MWEAEKRRIIERYDARLREHGDKFSALASGTEDRRAIRFQVLSEIGIASGDTAHQWQGPGARRSCKEATPSGPARSQHRRAGGAQISTSALASDGRTRPPRPRGAAAPASPWTRACRCRGPAGRAGSESVREITELFVPNSEQKAASAQSPHVGPMFCAGILSAADLSRTFGPQ